MPLHAIIPVKGRQRKQLYGCTLLSGLHKYVLGTDVD